MLWVSLRNVSRSSIKKLYVYKIFNNSIYLHCIWSDTGVTNKTWMGYSSDLASFSLASSEAGILPISVLFSTGKLFFLVSEPLWPIFPLILCPPPLFFCLKSYPFPFWFCFLGAVLFWPGPRARNSPEPCGVGLLQPATRQWENQMEP